MRNTIYVDVPKEVNYLSEFKNLNTWLPQQGHFIFQKGPCGCGCTEMYLRNQDNVILLSPRLKQIECKVDAHPNDLHYFDRSDKKVHKDMAVQRLLSSVMQCQYGNKPSKIIATYDSASTVFDVLEGTGDLGHYKIVVDEFNSIFNDVKMKGYLEMNLLSRFNSLRNNVAYISATPIPSIYLDQLPEFKHIPYVILNWDMSKFEKALVQKHRVRSVIAAIEEIIQSYKSTGYFNQTTVDGKVVYSTEAVFFVNNVQIITKIIERCGLTAADTMVICGETNENRKKLKELDLSIARVPTIQTYKHRNKPFTFVTKASFEGTDMYSDSSSCFVFSDPRQGCLSLDISIDLPQIAGRCRTKSNPFRRLINYYYTIPDKDTLDGEREKLEEKVARTERQLAELEHQSLPTEILEKISEGQKSQKYKKDYIEVEKISETESRLTFNKVAYVADLRAIDIKEQQYQSDYSIELFINNNSLMSVNTFASKEEEVSCAFFNEFNLDRDFSRRMRLYLETIDAYPDYKVKIDSIPLGDDFMEIQYYFNILGSERIYKEGCKRNRLDKEVKLIQTIEQIQSVIYDFATHGEFYTNAQCKMIMKQVYDALGLLKTPKATDMEKYISASAVKRTIDGKPQKGYIL